MAKDNTKEAATVATATATAAAPETITISKEEMAELLKAREAARKTKDTQRRQWVKQSLYAKKAKEAGITVTEAEIDEYIKKMTV